MLKICAMLVTLICLIHPGSQQAEAALNTNSPAQPARLIFIHHSTGENWLSDENGGLGMALRDNNYFVSDTNYGWGPDIIGDTTDIGHWWLWFRGEQSPNYLSALYAEGSQNASYSRLETEPSGQNEIIMFKSCFPNSALAGSPDDPIPQIENNPLPGLDAWSEYHTIANAKGIYSDLLEYFRTRQDKLFMAITAPPLSDPAYAANARALNEWLVNDWLRDYPYRNVAVFDFYNVLTTNGGNHNINDLNRETGNHHRYWNNAIQHKADVASDTAAYPSSSDDDHPSRAGNLKATGEFPLLLNVYYNCWKGTGGCPETGPVSSCSAALSSGFILSVPVIQYEGMSVFADFVFDPPQSGDVLFRVTSAGVITNPKDYSSCQWASLTSDATTFRLHIPEVIFGTISYWADLEYAASEDGQLRFRLTNAGQNP
ncbi:MAG: hypothetical protein HZA17_03050 [Nitrospirae bacterium]|nr:hypothetical protein [Nitrospirota bacterium]